MKSHVDSISKNPRVNIERVRSITYLYEFDRYGLSLNESSEAEASTENFKVQHGATLPKEHTTVMHLPVTRC